MKTPKKNTGFKLPDNYLENFNDALLDKIAAQENSGLPKKEGFKAPEGYFESLHENIVDKLKEPPTKVISLSSRKKYYYSAIAVAAVLLLFFGIQINQSNNLNIDDIASTDIDAYFEEIDLGLSTYEIAEVIPVDNLDFSDIIDTTFNDDDIVDYLDDNTDNINELNIESDEY